MNKPILVLDFDGVLHSYTSGWQGANVIPDPPVDGAIEFLYDAIEHFEVHIFSSRSHQDGGIDAMQEWIEMHDNRWRWETGNRPEVSLLDELQFPKEKPPAQITIDDRAILFTGKWPTMEYLKNFKPWYK